jgi:hypothetical protein
MRTVCWSLVALVLLLPAGCKKAPPGTGGAAATAGTGQPAVAKDDAEKMRIRRLQGLGMGYHNFEDANKRGPANAEDLKPFIKDFAGLYEGLKSGELVLVWNVDFQDTRANAKKGGTSLNDLVLGYESKVPNDGGLVLMGYGGVHTMTAAEFKAAPKAQPKN